MQTDSICLKASQCLAMKQLTSLNTCAVIFQMCKSKKEGATGAVSISQNSFVLLTWLTKIFHGKGKPLNFNQNCTNILLMLLSVTKLGMSLTFHALRLKRGKNA